jgi:hypothetical protein
MHKAKGNWDDLMKKRPQDADDLHKVFHLPYNPTTIYLLVATVFTIGVGSMQYGFIHQQYKQGYWK